MNSNDYCEFVRSRASKANENTVPMSAFEIGQFTIITTFVHHIGNIADYLKRKVFHSPDSERNGIQIIEDRGQMHSIVGLCSELPEYIEALQTRDKDKIANEAGDLLFYLTRGLIACGLTLDDAMQANVDKLQKRYPNGYTQQDYEKHAQARSVSGSADNSGDSATGE